ncbi:MAG: GNAT family N-acetyltransferase [Tissierellia bacterium]|nr:GNAT family N-acetyltransferase [Tissierellia bacterium]
MIRKCTINDLKNLTEMSIKLWPNHNIDEMYSEIADILVNENSVYFIAEEGGIAIGFAQCQIRSDYVEGTSKSPVGYLEAIYIEEDYRLKNYGSILVRACEEWTKENNCIEFGSDCEIENTNSYEFHLKMGFKEANRIICFTKKLD